MIGAIIGDFVGSAYEKIPTHDYNFEMITPKSGVTDDTIMTLAVADAILRKEENYGERMRFWGQKFPHPAGGGYATLFSRWLNSPHPKPYQSYGNGSAMRVAAIAWAFDDLFKAQVEACHSAECTHNHIEGIKGAVVTVTAIWLARNGADKRTIESRIEQDFGYSLDISLEEIRKHYAFDVTCQGTVPPAIRCFLESDGYEDCLRKAVTLGGDADTLSCIAGGIAEAFYGANTIDTSLKKAAFDTIPEELQKVMQEFCKKYHID